MNISAMSCPLCGTATSEVLTTELRRGDGSVYYCDSCDHGFLKQDQMFDAKEYYGENYRKQYSHNSEVAATNAKELFDVYNQYQKQRLSAITPYLNSATRLLEVGASSGQFLYHVKSVVGSVSAIELDHACCGYLKSELGIDTDSEFLENSKFKNDIFEVICSFQVIEHVEDPVAFLMTLVERASEKATIFIEAPNLYDPLRSIWDVPAYKSFFYHSAHLHYFTESSLRRVAMAAGFREDQIDISHTQDYSLLNHLHWIMNDEPQKDCHVGLSDIRLHGHDPVIGEWLTSELRLLNQLYVERLIAAKSTSNIMMRLACD